MGSQTPRKLRILQVASGDLWGGAEAQLSQLAKELQRSNIVTLSVVLLNHGLLEQRLWDERIDVTVFDESRLSSACVLWRLMKLVWKLRPDIVHTHRRKENVLGSIAALPVRNVKSIRTIHGREEAPPRVWQLHKKLYGWLDRISGLYLQDLVVCVSKDLAKVLSKKLALQHIHVVENGIDMQQVENRALEPVRLPGTERRVKIGFVGRLVPIKRIDLFLEIARQLAHLKKGVFSFYVLGSGPLSDEVSRKAKNFSVDDNLFVMGFVDNVAAHVAKMDMLVVTSDYEGIPMAVLEALCLRVPIVAHAVGGIPHLLDNGKCGTLVREQSAAEYVREILRYLDDRQLFLGKAESGYQHIEKHYTASENANNYLRLYSKISPVSSIGR